MASQRLAAASVATIALLAAACSDSSLTAPTPTIGAPLASVSARPVASAPSLRWNALARELVAQRAIDPPMASRVYALLSVAQHDAVLAADRVAPGAPRARHEVDARAAVIAASANVLGALFPLDAQPVADLASEGRAALASEGVDAAEARAASTAGEAAARAVLSFAATDGSGVSWTGAIPTGVGLWYSAVTASPLRPTWAQVRPWLLRSGDELRPAPPPAWGSAEYLAALAEVRRISDTRTPDQLRIALFWSDGAGTATPPGHWNAIAADLIARQNLDEEKATRVLALLNMALMDAGIGCWDAKYHYWLIRPSQADPQIVTAVPLPNFPSYVSGHATFSGAAAELLGAAFPEARASVDAMADEAAISRLYGGIHYRFDNEQGLALGRKIGRLAAARLRGSPLVHD